MDLPGLTGQALQVDGQKYVCESHTDFWSQSLILAKREHTCSRATSPSVPLPHATDRALAARFLFLYKEEF